MSNDKNKNINSTNFGRRKVPEKAKNFKSAIKVLMKNLKDFKVLIFTGLILAAIGSILSLVTPNRLSDLTDEISVGSVISSSKLGELTKEIFVKFDEQNAESTFKEIMQSSDFTLEDKAILGSAAKEIQSGSSDKIDIKIFNDLSLSAKEYLFPNSNFDAIELTTEDKLNFLNTMSDINAKSSTSDLYKAINNLSPNIRKAIEPKMNLINIKKISILLAILYIISALFNYIESLIMTTVSNKFAKKLRSKISNKINKVPLNYFDRNETGNLLSRVTNDVDTIAQSMNQSLATLVSSITLLIGSLIMMFYTNWIMAITAILSSLIGFIFMAIILSKSQKYFISRQEELGKLNGHIEEIYSGLNVVKAYNGKKNSDIKFDKLNENVYECNRKSQFLSGLMMPLMGFIGNFGYVAVCVVGAMLASKGNITFGVIVAFIIYVRLFSNPLSQIAQAMTSMQSAAAASERVFEFLDEPEMSNQKEIKRYLNKTKVKGNIDFEHVVFAYDDTKTIIKDFTASIKSGSKVAIVGPTGAGKTTMVNLLMKFYEINSGDIKIDGISTKDLTRENIHELFTMVLQDTWLFNGTIKENIIYNRSNVSQKRINEICEFVGIDHFIKTLPAGYDTILNDSDSISSGQKQLLTIARGMVEEAPFLILDEATSNVDTRTEELVQKAMDRLMEGRTSFIIAHRLSTIKNADLILVMKDGNIIEKGNHSQLMKQKGFYADLYNSQFKKNNI